jgi:superfamily II DNA or RNA helicase
MPPSSKLSIVESGQILTINFGGNIGLHSAITKLLSISHPNAYWMKKRSGKKLESWDGMITFYQSYRGVLDITAPDGFTKRLKNFLERNLIDYEWVTDKADHWVVPEFHQLSGFELDSDQVICCKALLNERRCSIEFATGSGKSLVAANAILCLTNAIPDTRALIIVPKLNLLYQTQKAIAKYVGDCVGIVGDGKFEWDFPIVVATANTACGSEHLKRSEEIRHWLTSIITVLIIDEAHCSTSSHFEEVIKLCPAERLWAMSAKMTYSAADKKHKEMALEGLFGTPVHSGRSEDRTCPVEVVSYLHPEWAGRFDGERLAGQLTDGTVALFKLPDDLEWKQGVWRGPDAKTNKVPSFMLVQTVTGKWKPDKEKFGIYYMGELLNDLDRESIVYWTRHDVAIMEFEERNRWALDLMIIFSRQHEPFIVTVKRRKHLNRMLRWALAAGLKVQDLGGHLTGVQQSGRADNLSAGKIDGIVAITSTIAMGVDIPSLHHIIKLDGLSEEQTLTQLIGRLQRIHPGKIKGQLHIPADEQLEALRKTTVKVLNYYRKQGLPVKAITYSSTAL